MSGRDRILRAALERFSQDGVAGTSLSSLRAAAGVSPGSFYHHFPGKQDVAAALYADAIDGYHRAFLEELHRDPDPARTVRGVVACHVSWCLSHEREARFLFTERRPATGALRELNRAFFREVTTWWKAQAHHGAVRPLDLTTCYVLWLGPAQELCRLWLGGAAPPPGPAQITELADAAWRSLRA